MRAQPPDNLSTRDTGDGGRLLSWSSPYPSSSSLNQNITFQLSYRTDGQDSWKVSIKHSVHTLLVALWLHDTLVEWQILYLKSRSTLYFNRNKNWNWIYVALETCAVDACGDTAMNIEMKHAFVKHIHCHIAALQVCSSEQQGFELNLNIIMLTLKCQHLPCSPALHSMLACWYYLNKCIVDLKPTAKPVYWKINERLCSQLTPTSVDFLCRPWMSETPAWN